MATIDDVLQAWAGLGYYQRARRLHEGAKVSKLVHLINSLVCIR